MKLNYVSEEKRKNENVEMVVETTGYNKMEPETHSKKFKMADGTWL